MDGFTRYMTRWIDGDIKVTLKDVLELTTRVEVVDPNLFKDLLIDTTRDPLRLENVDISYPVIVSRRCGVFTKVLDGQHRIVKAIREGQLIKVRYLDLDNAPDHIKKIFN